MFSIAELSAVIMYKSTHRVSCPGSQLMILFVYIFIRGLVSSHGAQGLFLVLCIEVTPCIFDDHVW